VQRAGGPAAADHSGTQKTQRSNLPHDRARIPGRVFNVVVII